MTCQHRLRHAAGERGTMTVELVLLVPLLFALLAFVVGLGRAADARGRLTGATRDAARAASLTSTPEAAVAAASAAARADLAQAGLECRDPQISTDTTAFRPGGQVVVTIRCTLDLSALAVSGLPGRSTLTARAAVPLDTYSGTISSAAAHSSQSPPQDGVAT
jgi:Flp pilus assembly protein TadG